MPTAKKESPRDQYFAGKITADEFLQQLFNSREADRKRQRTEKKFIELMSKINKNEIK